MLPSRVIERPFLVVKSLGHIDAFGERTADRWAVVRVSSGRIVKHYATEIEARQFANEANASRLLRRRRRR